MSIQVRLTTGVVNIHDTGVRIVVDDGTNGYLYVLGDDDLEVGIYAPTTWMYAEKISPQHPQTDNGHIPELDAAWPDPVADVVEH